MSESDGPKVATPESVTLSPAPADSQESAKSNDPQRAEPVAVPTHSYSGERSRPKMGRYIELVLLGAGGMGAVYRAYDPQLERLVAIKLMRDRSPTFVARFRREARAMARLSHPRVAQIYDYGEDEETGGPYFVMELVNGESVSALLSSRGRLDVAMVCKLLLQAAEGLEVAHGAGIIHRDIKPSNMVLDEAGDLKLVDFGIARMEEGHDALTRPQALVGTPHYMAPELVAGQPADARSDIYALGLTAFHMLTGRPAFDAPSAVAVAMKQISEQLPPIAPEAPDAPAWLCELIVRMTVKERERRIGSCSEICTVVRGQSIAGSSPAVSLRQQAGPGTNKMATKRPLPLYLAGISAGVLLCGVALLAAMRGGVFDKGVSPSGQDAGALPLAVHVDGGSVRAQAPVDLGKRAEPIVGTAQNAAQGPVRVSVLPFKNLGGDKDLEFLTEGISETVLTALGGHRDQITLLERAQVAQEIKEIDFEQTRYVDPQTRAVLGKLQGIEVAVQGGYQRAAGQIRITGRLVRVETGEILAPVVITKPQGALLSIQDDVAKELKGKLLTIVKTLRPPKE